MSDPSPTDPSLVPPACAPDLSEASTLVIFIGDLSQVPRTLYPRYEGVAVVGVHPIASEVTPEAGVQSLAKVVRQWHTSMSDPRHVVVAISVDVAGFGVPEIEPVLETQRTELGSGYKLTFLSVPDADSLHAALRAYGHVEVPSTGDEPRDPAYDDDRDVSGMLPYGFAWVGSGTIVRIDGVARVDLHADHIRVDLGNDEVHLLRDVDANAFTETFLR